MMTLMTHGQPETCDGASSLYRAFWRWHFYAGLLVMPVLMLMALTGGLYLFKDDIEGLLQRPLLTVTPRPAVTAPQAWVDAARRTAPGRVVQVVVPARPDRSVRVTVEATGGARRAVFVDPHDAKVLGVASDGGLMQTLKRIHSLEVAGKAGNLLVELAAGWAIVMAATGLVLWWPRGRSGGVVTVRGRPQTRVFWRDLHAVTGVFAAGLIAFLAATGMPWSGVWGQQVRKLTNEAGWGRPPPPAGAAAWSHGPSHRPAVTSATPWALQGSSLHSSHGPGRLTVDGAVARLDAAGLRRPYVLNVPDGPQTWSASHTSDRAGDMRTVYLDGASGRVLADIGYSDFGPAARAIEWGISAHQGREFGLADKLLMLTGCLAIWLLGVSAVVMWWKRRPKGRLGAPPPPVERRAYAALAGVVIPLALLYPLVGASLVAVLAIDFLFRRIAPTMRPAPKVRP